MPFATFKTLLDTIGFFITKVAMHQKALERKRNAAVAQHHPSQNQQEKGSESFRGSAPLNRHGAKDRRQQQKSSLRSITYRINWVIILAFSIAMIPGAVAGIPGLTPGDSTCPSSATSTTSTSTTMAQSEPQIARPSPDCATELSGINTILQSGLVLLAIHQGLLHTHGLWDV